MKESPEPLTGMFFSSPVSEQLNVVARNRMRFLQGGIASFEWEGWWCEETLNDEPLALLNHRSGSNND